MVLLFRFLIAFSFCAGWEGLICKSHSQDILNQPVASSVRLHNDAVGDQDDLCFWANGKDPSESRVFVSDKKANSLFVYSLDGHLAQKIEVAKPGNIDIRRRVVLGGEASQMQPTDVVAVNVRADGWKVRVFSVSAVTYQLEPIDAGGFATRPNYGSCLAYDSKSQKLSYIATSESSGVTQYEISRLIDGRLACKEINHWDLGKCEGIVADDETGKVYVAVEQEGIWQLSIDALNQKVPELVIALGKNGLAGDLEGLTLATLEDTSRVLIVSSQGLDKFFVFDRQSPWNCRGSFQIDGVTETDGIDLIQSNEIPHFPGGIFGCHTSQLGHPITLASWKSILVKLEHLKSDAFR